MSYFVLLLTLGIYIIRPGDWVAGMDMRWNLTLNIIGAVTFLGAVATGKAKEAADRTWAYLAGFWCLMMVSSLANGQASTISLYTPQMLTNILVFFLLCTTVDTKAEFRFLILVFLALTLFVSYQCHIQIVSGVNYAGLPPLRRAENVFQALWVGVFNDPNDVGLLFTALFPLVFAKALLLPTPPLLRVLWGTTGCILLYSIFLTNSRGTFLATMAGVGFFFIIRYRSTWGLIVASVLGLGMLTLGPSRMSSLTSADDSAMERVYAWIEAMNVFAWKPFLGTGPRHWLDYHHLTTHNSFVLAFVENGFAGYVCWLSVLLVPLYVVSKVSLHSNSKEQRIESAAIAACLIGVLVDIFFISRTYIMLPFFMAALTLTYARLHAMEVYSTSIVKPRPLVLCFVAATTVVGVWATNRLTTMLML